MSASASLLPEPRAVFYDANGAPLSGGFVYTYVPGGTTPKTTWQDDMQTTPNSNPVTLDANGSCLLYGNGAYQITVTDALGNAVPAYSGLSQDPLSLIASEFLPLTGGTLTGPLTVDGTIAATGVITAANGTAGSQVVNFSQFGATNNPAGSIHLPNGITLQWGNSSGPTATVTFPYAFSATPYSVQCTLKDAPSGGLAVFVELTTAYSATGFTAETITAPATGVAANFFWFAVGPT